MVYNIFIIIKLEISSDFIFSLRIKPFIYQPFCLTVFASKSIISEAHTYLFFFAFLFFILFYFFLILKSLILTCVPKHEPPSHLPPHNISLGHPHAPAPSMRCPASDIDW